MTRILRAALIAGLTTLALMVLPPVVNTTLAAECQCSGASTVSEQATCTACAASCASSGMMTRWGTVAGSRCIDDTHVDTTSAPSTEPVVEGTPEVPDAVGTADVSYCTEGSPLEQVKCNLLIFIAEILNVIASFLGKVLVFLVDILISFASYNGFGDAIVVQRGWVVVRDVVNMFFIVILLVSAFATIIGYDENNFHYKRVLPKLLLMVVLINFSRTLIQLLVDFSQVIMLTFVNAFASAGPGNLVSALKLDRILAMAPPSGGGSIENTAAQAGLTGTVDPINIILALMLAIFLLSISLGVVIIMTAYLIFRIVGLWIALILSPLALFVTALPGRLAKGMGAFAGDYWTRLSALLTGGPVMAFFLWLTFAITQSSAGAGGLAQAVNIHTNNPAVSFLTSIGNSQDIASFIVGVTLMLMGLDAAVSAASAVNKTLGQYAGKVSGASQALGRLAATAPFLGAYYGGRAIDRRLDISGKAATAAFAATSAVPVLRSLTRAPLVAAMGRNKKLDKAEAAEYQKGLEYLSPSQRAIAAFATPAGVTATKGQKQAYVQQMTERAGEKNAKTIKDQLMPSHLATMTKEHEDELRSKNPSWDSAQIKVKMEEDKDLIKNRASQSADQEVMKRQASFLKAARDTADKMGDQDAVRQIDDQLKKNPNLSTEKDKLAKKLLADPDAMNAISDQAKGDMGVLTALLEQSKALKIDANGKMTFDRAKLDGFTDKIKNKDLKDNIDMLVKLTRGSPGLTKTNLDKMVIGKNEKGKKRIFSLNESTSPVMSERAVQAEAAFKAAPTSIPAIETALNEIAADEVFKNQPSFDTYAIGAVQDANALGSWKVQEQEVQVIDAITGKPQVKKNGDPVMKKVLVNNMKREDVEPLLKKFETMASKMEDMSTEQQTNFAGMMADSGIIQTIINAKRAEFTDPQRDKTFKKYLEMLTNIESELKKTGKDPKNFSVNETRAVAALNKAREAFAERENSSVSSAYRKSIEPEEIK